ncbi:rhodanese-like domain-containing protein 8, chloroplastic [Chenopodium quinoa]|uniref:rhodanese-like domain-containing protein 8, chloroplastic n=1 Tax=Chenopodium quinoa TaxID=63459 RepID=UPI000B776F5A|nr:rhodanese-like domain-containing protein 8, chloroplastic [Chenopodium quinoa]
MASLNFTLPPLTPISFSLSSLTQFHGRTLPHHHSSIPASSLPILPHGQIQLMKFKTPNISCTFSLISDTSGIPIVEDDESGFIVVNFYHFVYIEDPEFEVSKHLSVLEELDIHGRIYINEQGVNAQFSGPSKDAMSYVKWLRDDQRFTDILVQISPSSGHAFPRLKMRYKPSLVQFDLGAQDLPLLDPSMRAEPLSPSEWRARLKSLDSNHDKANDDHKSCILLDVRNGYEWDIGHFQGAQRPEVDCFRTTSFGLSNLQVTDSDPLVNVDKDNTDILMYCTGGIRCDVYSTILRQKGFKNLYTLKGGVSNYLKKEGPEKWVGNLFVFDSRLSLPPATFKPGATTSSGSQEAPTNSKFARCYICGSQVNELRHRNCANLDCNLLFLCCRNCVEGLRGCCCSNCKTAPRLRPVLFGSRRYQKWHLYRDSKVREEIS